MLGFPRIVDEVSARMVAAVVAVATLTGVAAAFLLGPGLAGGWWLVGAVVGAAGLESRLGICLGCLLFDRLMRIGLVPASVCAECADFMLRRPPARA